MANGSTPSFSETELGLAEDFAKETPQPTWEDQLVEQTRQQEVGRLGAVARQARKYQPDEWAQAKKVSNGLPLDVVLRNKPELEQTQLLQRYRSVFESNDSLRAHFTRNPDDLPPAAPEDLESLTGVDWLFKATGAAYDKGWRDVELSELRYRQLEKSATEADLQRLQELENDPDRALGADGWFSSGATGLSQMIPYMMSVAAEGFKGGVSGAALGGAIGSVSGPGSVFTAAGGFTAGGAAGAYLQTQRLLSGQAYDSLKQITNEDGEGLDEETIRGASIVAGTMMSALELIGIGKIASLVPGAGKVATGFLAQNMTEALAQPTIRAALSRFGAGVAAAGGTEIATELAQEYIQIFAEESSKLISDNGVAPLTPEEIVERLGETAIQTAQIMTLLGPFAAGTRLGRDLYTIRQSKRRNDKLQEAIEKMDPALAERDPEVAARIIDSLAPDEKLYLPADQVMELYQSQGEDPYAITIPNWRTRLDEALVTGTIELSVGEYFGHLAKNPKDDPLRELVRTGPDDFSRAEMQKYSDAFDETLKGETERAGMAPAQNARTISAPSSIFEDVKRQLVETGLPEAQAEQYATLQDAFFQTMAERAGRTAEELYQEFGARIERGEARFAPQSQESMTTLDQPAYHGSPHVFDEFSLEKIGTGEGAQAYGWGLYFAQEQVVAKIYRENLSRNRQEEAFYQGVPVEDTNLPVEFLDRILFEKETPEQAKTNFLDHRRVLKATEFSDLKPEDAEWLGTYGGTFEEAASNLYQKYTNEEVAPEEYYRYLDLNAITKEYAERDAAATAQVEAFDPTNFEIISSGDGRLFTVDIPDEGYLLWDEPVDEQPTLLEIVTSSNLPPMLTGPVKYSGMTGQEFYRALTEYLGSKQEASKFLNEAGLKGIKYLDGKSRYAGEGTYNFVIFDDKDVKVIAFEQPGKKGPRGNIEFGSEQTVINLFEAADLSTFLHESAHQFLGIMEQLAPSTPEIAADLQLILDTYAPKTDADGNTLSGFAAYVEIQEGFARAFEAYLMEGKAPSPELRGAFESFKRWLTFIYRQIKRLGGPVTPEIRGVMDRMIATEDRMREVQDDIDYSPIFKDAQEMGVPEAEYLAYVADLDAHRAQALDTARGRAVGQQKRIIEGWRKEIAAQLRKEIKEKLLKLPPYSHAETFKKPDFKIARADLVEAFGADAEKLLPRGAVKKEGLPVEVAAAALGYPSADEMLYDFRQAAPLREVIEAEVRAEMLSRFGDDLADSDTLDIAVRRALANDTRKLILAKEVRYLNRKGGRNVTEATAIRRANEMARHTFRGKKVADALRAEAVYRADVRRYGRAAENAMIKGDWVEAAELKRKQLVVFALEQEAIEVAKSVERIRSKAQRYTRTRPKSVDNATMEQIRELVTRFEFTRRTNKRLAERETLAKFLEKAEIDGLVHAVPRTLYEDAKRVNYKMLSVEELLGMGDALTSLEKIGRDRYKVLVEGRKIEHSAIVADTVTSIRRRPTKPQRMKSFSKRMEGLKEKTAGAHAYMLKPERIMEWLDLGDIKGPMGAMFQSIAKAEATQRDMMDEYGGALVKLFESIDKSHLKESVRIRSMEPGTTGNKNLFTREELYAFALNIGNESNREKLMRGFKLNDVQYAELLSHLTPEDMDRVQAAWDVLEKLWPKIEALEKRLTGVAPKRVERRSFNFKGKEYAGGYYPVVYDRKNPHMLEQLVEEAEESDRRVESEDLFKPSLQLRPGTEHSYTKTRVKVAHPIALDMNVLPNHLQTVIHDLTHREPVRAAYQILWDPRVHQAITDVEGEPVYRALQDWLRNVATPDRNLRNLSTGNKVVQKLRANTVMFGLGFRATTALAQPLGLFNSMERVGHKAMGRAIYQWTRNPIKNHQMIASLSGEMRHRFNQQDKDLRDNLKKFSLQESKMDKVRTWAMWHISMFDRFTSEITWLATYSEQINKDPGDMEAAIAAADRTVRLSQGTGNVKDMAQVQMDKGAMSMLTMFFSFFSAQYNAQVELTRRTGRAIKEPVGWAERGELLAKWAYITIIPATVGALVTGRWPEEDESWLYWTLKKTLLYPFMTIPGVREVAGAIDSGFGYSLSPLERVGGTFYRTLTEAGGLLGDDPDVRATVKATAETATLLLGLPGGAPIQAIDSIWQGIENDDFEWTDPVFGRQGR